MTVDLKTLKEGDTVLFPTGGKIVADRIRPSGLQQFPLAIGFQTQSDVLHYYAEDGTKGRDDQLLRIVAIEPAPQPTPAQQVTVDLKTLKPNDTVHFRCGGKAIAAHLERTPCTEYPYGVQFNRYDRFHEPDENYRADGTCRLQAFPHPLDIVRIESAPPPSIAEQCATLLSKQMAVMGLTESTLGSRTACDALAVILDQLRALLTTQPAADDGWVTFDRPAKVHFKQGVLTFAVHCNAYRIAND